MFTGMIEAVGVLEALERIAGGARLRVDAGSLSPVSAPGDSISIDGVCLTLERQEGRSMEFSLSRETLAKTRFAKLRRGARVNIERAVRADQALGGHIVTGHVDGLANVRTIRRRVDSTEVELAIPPGVEALLVSKGSVALNGVSLTVATLAGRTFGVALAPYTLRRTNLSDLRSADAVHFEADILGKYVVRYLSALPRPPRTPRERKRH